MSLQMLINGLSLGGVYATIAVGFALVYNILKFSNFSHSGILVSTAYIGFFIANKLGTNFWMTLLLTGFFGGCLALLVEFIGFRRLRLKNVNTMLYFVSSITLSMLMQNLITVLFSTSYYSYPVFFKTSSFNIGGLMFVTTDILMLVISCIALAILQFILKKTRIGVAIRALSTDSNTTSLMGINVTRIVMATFFVSGVLGGISGMFLGINYTLYPQLGGMITKGFIASIIGGLGNVSGAVMGAFILGLAEVFLVNIDFIGSSFTPVVTFLVMIVFLLVRPQGLAGTITKEKV